MSVSLERFGMPVVLRIIPVSFINFCTYLGVGIPLSVLPGYVIDQLGYGPVLAGLSVSAQFLATVLTRSVAGRMSDAIGAKRTVIYGLVAATIAGALLLLGGLAGGGPAVGYGFIVVSRLCLGFGESCSGTATITWNIGRVGAAQASRVMAWGGVAAYGAIAAGAPIGALIYEAAGLWAVGAASTLAGIVGLAVALLHAPIAIVAGVRTRAGRTLQLVLPFGAALTLGAAGFGAVASFGSLLFADAGWTGAPILVSLFGLSFAGARLLLGGTVERFGGYRVAALSLTAEAIGLAVIWLAPGPSIAFVGAGLAGLGFGMVFPALGVELMKLFPASSRGGALGLYTVFLDLALAATGPLAGLLLPVSGYPGIFAAAALATLLGTLFVLQAHSRAAGT